MRMLLLCAIIYDLAPSPDHLFLGIPAECVSSLFFFVYEGVIGEKPVQWNVAVLWLLIIPMSSKRAPIEGVTINGKCSSDLRRNGDRS